MGSFRFVFFDTFLPLQMNARIMTGKLFWRDPYLTEIQATVAAVTGPRVILEQTIFFAFSGGQESDTGSIGGYPVMEVRKVGHDIEYLLPEDHLLYKGQLVTVRIDWPRRYRLMRLHFAAELILELVYARLPGVEKIGAHISEQKARLDFAWPSSVSPLLAELTARAQAVIAADAAIISAFSDEQKEKRYWEIKNFAQVPCGGTHLKSTGEIGTIRLKRNNIGQGKERIEIYLEE